MKRKNELDVDFIGGQGPPPTKEDLEAISAYIASYKAKQKARKKKTSSRRINSSQFTKSLKTIHPGEVLQEEFLIPLNITAYKLAKDILIPQTRVAAIIKGNRRITADTAIRLSIYFGISPKFWLGLQDDYDVEEVRIKNRKELQAIKRHTM